MGRIYTVAASFTLTNAGGDTDLLELLPADDKPIKLRRFTLSQTSEVQDAMEENLRILIRRASATVTSGSGGSVITPTPVKRSSVASGFTAEVNNTTLATTSGAFVTIAELGWNERNTPFEYVEPEDAFAADAIQAEGLFIHLPTAPADDIVMQLTAWVEEEG